MHLMTTIWAVHNRSLDKALRASVNRGPLKTDQSSALTVPTVALFQHFINAQRRVIAFVRAVSAKD